MAKAVHTMIRVLDEERSINFYKSSLGLEVADRFGFDGFTLVYMHNAEADFEIELTVNHDQKEPYTHGTGYGHLAVVVDDLDAEHERVAGLGLAPTDVKEFYREESLMAKFFFLQDPDGYKIEFIQNHGRYR